MFFTRKRRKIDYHEHEDPASEEFPGFSGVASATELTGAAYRAPQNRQERENLEGLFPQGLSPWREEPPPRGKK